MTPPNTYASWVDLLDRFGKGDDVVLDSICNGTIQLDAGNAIRFYAAVNDAYKNRKQLWMSNFQRSFTLLSYKSINEIAITLRHGKQNLLPLAKFAAAKSWPQDLQKTLQKDLEDFVATIKKSLVDNMATFTKERDKIMLQLNTFGLFDAINENNAPPTTPATGRKIIL